MNNGSNAAVAARVSEAVERTSVARGFVIATMAFLTVVDLFAAQALLPSLVAHYSVSPAAMSLAVNACTLGMAVAGLLIALFGRGLDQRTGVIASLATLSIPTALLAAAPDLASFAALRVAQGALMATAFSLTLGYLGDRYTAAAAAGAFAAYITGNVASNLIGRLIAAASMDIGGLSAAFFVFAALNLAGALLAAGALTTGMRMPGAESSPSSGMNAAKMMSSWRSHLSNGVLLAGFGIGFCILFAFIGVFTFVNFVLSRPPLSVGMMTLGFIYFVFLPSVITTPFAGRLGLWLGFRRALWLTLGVAAVGLPLLLSVNLTSVLAGMTLVAIGTFAAQALATGFVSRAAKSDRAGASGIYLASYYLGGLTGTAFLGLVFERFGWGGCVLGVGAALAVAALLTIFLVQEREVTN